MFRNLEAELCRADITKKKLAEKLGCNPCTLSSKLNGKSPVTLCEAFKITEIIHEALLSDFTVEYLFANNIDKPA